MKKRILLMALVFSLCAVGHAPAATITVEDVFEAKKGYSFDLNIDWDDALRQWTGLSTSKQSEGGMTFSTQGGLKVNNKGEPTSFDTAFMDNKNPNKAAWAYRMEISLHQTASGEWDWYGTIQRWEKGVGQNKNKFVLAGQINKPMQTPVPGAAWLLGAGLIGLVGVRYRFGRGKMDKT